MMTRGLAVQHHPAPGQQIYRTGCRAMPRVGSQLTALYSSRSLAPPDHTQSQTLKHYATPEGWLHRVQLSMHSSTQSPAEPHHTVFATKSQGKAYNRMNLGLDSAHAFHGHPELITFTQSGVIRYPQLVLCTFCAIFT